MILVLAVPHTGTRFCQMKVVNGIPHMVGHIPPGRGREWGMVARAEMYPTIVPIRHPMAVVSSHIARKESWNLGCWDTLIGALDPLGPYYLPLDVTNKKPYLQRIEDLVGKKIDTSEKVNHTGGSDVPGHVREQVQFFMSKRRAFFERFYDDICDPES